MPGKLLVKGRVQILGVTEDGFIPYLLLAAGQARLEVLDTKTNTSIHVGAAPFGSRVAVRGKTIALWTTPLGNVWSGLTVWSAANGVARAPAGATSIAPLLAANAGGTRIAMAWGDLGDPLGITNVATAGSKLDEAPEIVVPHVVTGTAAKACTPAMRFAGARLFVASCEGSQTSATVRTISETNEVTTLADGVLANGDATFSTDDAGHKVFVVDGEAKGAVHSVPANEVTPIASNVASGMLLPDGNAVLYTTSAGSLVRATTSMPVGATPLVAAGAREVLLVSPDGQHAIVASEGPSLHDLKLASTSVAAPLVTLVATASGVPIGFTRSGRHFLYLSDVAPSDSSTAKVRAHVMASGEDITLGANVTSLALMDEERRALVGEVRGSASDLKLVDLETGSSVPLANGVYTATAYRRTAYYSVGFAGLYSIDLD